MCPIRIHWHVKVNYKEYWRVKVTITNFNYRMNYSQWNLVVQHPNFDNLTQIFSFNFKPLTPYQAISKSYGTYESYLGSYVTCPFGFPLFSFFLLGFGGSNNHYGLYIHNLEVFLYVKYWESKST